MNTDATMRVLVAGATGYLGGFVAREPRARGRFVRALARRPEKLAGLKELLDEVVQAEVTRPESLTHVCDGIDVVGPVSGRRHLAGYFIELVEEQRP